jgi:hypothetical protein
MSPRCCPIEPNRWMDRGVREDVVVQGTAMKREKHEVAPSLVVG